MSPKVIRQALPFTTPAQSGTSHRQKHKRSLAKKMISMTAAELAKVADKIHHDDRAYAPSTDHHDRYGNDTDDHHMFDHNHIEDVFPY